MENFNNFVFYINQPISFKFDNGRETNKKIVVQRLQSYYNTGFRYIMELFNLNVLVYCPTYVLIPLWIAKFDGTNLAVLETWYRHQTHLFYRVLTPKLVILCPIDWDTSSLCAEIVILAKKEAIPCLKLEMFLRGKEELI